jgi:hypothetical protein
MLLSFLTASIVGLAIGYFFRVGALGIASLVFLVYAGVLFHGHLAARAIAISLALLATMQAAYICGLALRVFGQKFLRSFEGNGRTRTCRREPRKTQVKDSHVQI